MTEDTQTKSVQQKKINVSHKQKNKTGLFPFFLFMLFLVSIAIVGVSIYYLNNEKLTSQQQDILMLQQEIELLKEASDVIPKIEHNITQLDFEQKSLNNELTNFNNENQLAITNLNKKLAAITRPDTINWLISEANYLIRLAERKIWHDQDYQTALLLLKDADSNLKKINDTRLLSLRSAIAKDINILSKIDIIDSDGIIIKLMRLSDELIELPLLDNYKDTDLGLNQYHEVTEPSLNETSTQNSLEAQSNVVTSSLADWYNNLLHNSQQFLQKLVTIKKIDTEHDYDQCITKAGEDETAILRCQLIKKPLSLDDSFNLRENIRLRLFIAAQAIPRHQDLIYHRALNDVDVWVNAYFDSENAKVNVFLNELSALQNNSISMDTIPKTLTSRTELDNLIQSQQFLFLTQ